jgi:hypothetical protein
MLVPSIGKCQAAWREGTGWGGLTIVLGIIFRAKRERESNRERRKLHNEELEIVENEIYIGG